MAKKKKEVVEKTTKETKVNEPKGDVKEVQETMKMKPIDLDKETITRVNLDKPIGETEVEEVSEEPIVALEEIVEQPSEVEETIETPMVEEITNEEKVEEIADTIEEAMVESIETGKDLPENIQKLMDFMDDTGGDLNDYVNLNKDYSDLDNDTLLKEYYKQTKPHLDTEEIEFLMEDNFSFDQDMDEKIEIKRKKLALKEQVANAKSHLDGLKSKYYEDIKSGGKLTSEQQEAVEFFNKYTKESKESQEFLEQQANTFTRKTDQVFDDKFKGFEYKVGDKKFRFNVGDPKETRAAQGDINNFIKKFLNKDMQMEDAAGYHKSLYTAMNADVVANHFYEQGKADALKQSIAKSKNIDMTPRQSHSADINADGIKVRALNDDGPGFKFQIKNKNK